MNDHHRPLDSDCHDVLPISFHSVNQNTGSGALAYIVLVPFLTVALYAMVGGILLAMLRPLGMDELLLSQVLAAILLPLAFIVVTTFAVKDYRRRAGARIDVFDDSVVVASAFHEQRFDNADIANVRIVPERSTDACRLELKDGRRIHLLSEVATFDQLRPAFEASLIPDLVDRLQLKLNDGSTIQLSENKLRALFRVIAGITRFSLGLLFFYLVPFIPWMPGATTSLLRIRRGWRGLKAGFSMNGKFVTRSSLIESHPIELDSLTDVIDDQIGLSLKFTDTDTISVSIYARNYWTVSFWLSEHFGQFDRLQ